MKESQIHQVGKGTWTKFSFYLNVVMFLLVGIFNVLLITDSYNAGKLVSAGGDILTQALLLVMRDVAILAICLTVIFFQLFRYQREINKKIR